VQHVCWRFSVLINLQQPEAQPFTIAGAKQLLQRPGLQAPLEWQSNLQAWWQQDLSQIISTRHHWLTVTAATTAVASPPAGIWLHWHQHHGPAAHSTRCQMLV
jgi:hypothetical protein